MTPSIPTSRSGLEDVDSRITERYLVLGRRRVQPVTRKKSFVSIGEKSTENTKVFLGLFLRHIGKSMTLFSLVAIIPPGTRRRNTQNLLEKTTASPLSLHTRIQRKKKPVA